MNTYLGVLKALPFRRVGLMILCCLMLALLAAPARTEEISDGGICSFALPVGSATGCGAVITVTSVDANGVANGFTVTNTGNGNPYDGDEDTLIGVQNNSGATLNSMPLTSSASPGIFQFDLDGPCQYAAANNSNSGDCFTPPFPEGYVSSGYEGPNNTFAVTDGNHGTVNFYTCPDACAVGIAAGGSTWFALEGTPNSLTLISETQTLTFIGGVNNQTQNATFGTGDTKHTAAFTIPTVNNRFQINETAHYVNTEFVPGVMSGPGVVDGVCEFPPPNPVPDDDIDCRLAAGGFVFFTEPNGDQVVPHAFPYHNNQAVWYRATTTAQSGIDYVGPVTDAWTWELNPSLAAAPANPEYAPPGGPGWNNENGRVYDRPGVNPANPFVADITTFFQGCCGAGGRQPTLNDWVIAAVPNPQTGNADQEITLLPLPFAPSPAPYIKGLPMPVSFTLVNKTTKKLDPTALSLPNTVNISTQDSNGNTIPLQFPNGFPTTFQCVIVNKKCTGIYGIVLSSTPYQKGMTYNLQIGSDLFTAPVNIPFVVK